MGSEPPGRIETVVDPETPAEAEQVAEPASRGAVETVVDHETAADTEPVAESASDRAVETVVDPDMAADAEPVAESDETSQRPRAAPGPGVLVGLAVVFNLWTLRGETVPTQSGNDSNLHEAMVRWALHRLELKQTVFDGWFPDFGLGFPQFHQYQSLPHIITAYISRIFGEPDTYAWSLYLLLALWPICVYLSVRLFGLSAWSAAAAAAVAPLLVAGPASTIALGGYGYEFGSYIWRGHGLWPQLWGMWLLPLSLALSWRAIARRESMALAAVVTGLTIACHLITGYLVLIAIVLWSVLVPSELRTRLLRGAIVGAGSLLVAAWVIVPFLADQKFAVYASLRGSIWNDSYGARKTLEWLVTGELFDSGRFPVVTILVAIGAIVCASRWRRDEASRAVLAFFLLGLLLFSGRPTLGAVADALPGADALYFPRFIIAVHFGGIVLAGIGAAWLGVTAVARVRRMWTGAKPRVLLVAAVVVFIAALTPAWSERADYAGVGREEMGMQRAADATDGADVAALIEQTRGQGFRVFAGLSTGGGKTYRIGYVPVYAELVNRGVDSLGFLLRVSALSTAVEPQFDATRSELLDLFNVGYAILPANDDPPPTATLVTSRGRHRLWKLGATTGYLGVVDTVGPPIVADRTNLARRVQPWMGSPLVAERKFPTVAFEGDAAAQPTLLPGQATSVPPGRVLAQYARPEDGSFGGQVRLSRTSVVLLKATYHPRWEVTVDGQRAQPEFIAPSFVGVKVPAGDHAVAFQYRVYPSRSAFFFLAAGGVAGLFALDRFLAVRRKESTEEAEGEEAEGDEGTDAEGDRAAEQDEVEGERVEAERDEAERPDAERMEAERREAELRASELREAERLEAELREMARLEAARREAARLESERLEAERLEAERLEAERLEAERLEAERLESERLEAERREAARLEAERREAARLEAERREAERIEVVRLEAVRLEADRVEEPALPAARSGHITPRFGPPGTAITVTLPGSDVVIAALLSSNDELLVDNVDNVARGDRATIVVPAGTPEGAYIVAASGDLNSDFYELEATFTVTA